MQKRIHAILCLTLLLGWLVLPLKAQAVFPNSDGEKVRYNATIEMKKGYMSGICILLGDEGVVKGSLFNEFGISALDFIYQPDKRKVKLLSVIKMLDKWYIKRVLRQDLVQVMERLQEGKGEYRDEKYKINYQFTLLEKQEDVDVSTVDDTAIINENNATEE